MNLEPKKLLTCEDCGEQFLGLFARYCDKCRKKRRQTRPMRYKICEKCGQKRKMYEEQVVCRLCKEAELRQDREHILSVEKMQEIQLARKTGGKLVKIEKCPNYNGQDIRCVTCPAGSWEFKDCGKIVATIFLMLLSTFMHAYTIKATGTVVAVIVEAPEVYEQTVVENKTVVYTEVGPTLQVVF